jgi:hypothetical protein
MVADVVVILPLTTAVIIGPCGVATPVVVKE